MKQSENNSGYVRFKGAAMKLAAALIPPLQAQRRHCELLRALNEVRACVRAITESGVLEMEIRECICLSHGRLGNTTV